MIKQIESLFNEIPRQPRDAFIVQTSLGGGEGRGGSEKKKKKGKRNKRPVSRRETRRTRSTSLSNFGFLITRQTFTDVIPPSIRVKEKK